MKVRSYSELARLQTFEERFEYLVLSGQVGAMTFGFDRYINQQFYQSREWRDARDYVILRDEGCDLGIPGREIPHRLLVHHINPLTQDDIRLGHEVLIDPENLICCEHHTHNALHYGNYRLMPQDPKERKPGDTRLW